MTHERSIPVPLHPVVAKFRRLEAELNETLIGREAEIRGALLALAARQHVFYLSPPGGAKSLMASEVGRRIRGEGTPFFNLEFNPFILREEIFGPISIRAMRESDSLARRYQGFLPSATVALLDELWKAPPALLNTMLRILNEREFRNDTEVVRSPLITAFVASNELPPADRSLDALYDRILLRYDVKPLVEVTDRKRATAWRLRFRAFEATVTGLADNLARKRAHALAELRKTADQGGGDRALVADRYAAIEEQGLPAHVKRPERWIIDTFGEILSDPELREHVALGEFLPTLPLDRRELDAIYRLVLAVEFPETVEAAFYRILDGLGGSPSVRRETELRTVIAAQAVLEGRMTASIEDLEIMIHALWNRPQDIPTVKRAVQKETLNVRRELDALLATLTLWEHEILSNTDVAYDTFRARRRQMEQELKRFEALAEAYPSNEEVLSAGERAREIFETYTQRTLGPDISPSSNE